MWDLAESPRFNRPVRGLLQLGKLIALVCHSLACFVMSHIRECRL